VPLKIERPCKRARCPGCVAEARSTCDADVLGTAFLMQGEEVASNGRTSVVDLGARRRRETNARRKRRCAERFAKGQCDFLRMYPHSKRDSKIAVLPIGYYDGIARISSGKSQMILRGKKVPQIGRVTMNLIVIDVTDVKGAKIGDVVTIIGKDGKSEITADDWAEWSQTINYEVVARLNSAITRVQS
jgi:hypothetical protein